MKYLKLFEKNGEAPKQLEKLYLYLKDKGLEVELKKNIYDWSSKTYYLISGLDFSIFFETTKFKDKIPHFVVSYNSRPIINNKGERAAKHEDWKEVEFFGDRENHRRNLQSDFEKIYDFVKNIYWDNETKRYNL